MEKFKVGDKVMAISEKYMFTRKSAGWEGIVSRICKDSFDAKTTKCPNFNDYLFTNLCYEDFEKIGDETPVIVEHLIRGNKTIIKLSNGKVGIAKCSPEDKFNVATGAAIATARAYEENPKNAEPVFKVGQLVQVKEWDEIAKEYGLDEVGDIKTKINFVRDMRKLCGAYAEITGIDRHRVYLKFFNLDPETDTDYFYTTDMIKLVEKNGGGKK